MLDRAQCHQIILTSFVTDPGKEENFPTWIHEVSDLFFCICSCSLRVLCPSHQLDIDLGMPELNDYQPEKFPFTSLNEQTNLCKVERLANRIILDYRFSQASVNRLP